MKKRFWLLLIPGILLTAFASFSCIFPLVSPVTQVCSVTSPGAVDATFHWLPSIQQGETQWVDISYFSTFPPGQFGGFGPFDETVNNMTWGPLQANTIYHWRVNALVNGAWFTSTVGTFTTMNCGTGDGSAYPTGLRLAIPKIGVNAPVNVRVIGADGAMGTPNGKDDVVWYDFGAFGGMGGFPGTPGANAMFSGHVDYHPHYEAVFWSLRDLVPGDEIDVYLLDGTLVRYAVQWSTWIGGSDNFSNFATQTGFDALTIVTCTGTFNPDTHSYDNRLVVRAARIY